MIKSYLLNPFVFVCFVATVLTVQLDGDVGENSLDTIASCERQCLHGICDNEGVCMCNGCWAGQYCQDYVNERAPEFVRKQDTVEVNLASSEPVIYRAAAKDEDVELCEISADCPCGTVVYELDQEASYSAGLFSVEPSTGDVLLTGGALMYTHNEYRLVIRAANEDGFGFHELLLTVIIIGPFDKGWSPRYAETDGKIPGYDGSADAYREGLQSEFGAINGFPEEQAAAEASKPHSRQKRDLDFENDVADTVPTEVTFYYHRDQDDQYTAYIGEMFTLHFRIAFPRTAGTDMHVEIFTPNNETTYMKLCDVRVTWGSDLRSDTWDGAENTFVPTMEAKEDSPELYDVAILEFGTVSSADHDSDTSDATAEKKQSMIEIEFDALVVGMPDVDNTQDYVAVGAAYNNEEDVYIGLAPFTFTHRDVPEGTHEFTVTGPTDIEVGDVFQHVVEAGIVDDEVALTFDAFTPLGDADQDKMSVCDVSVHTRSSLIGSNVGCSIFPDKTFTPTPSTADPNSNYHGHLDIGKVWNKQVARANMAHTVTDDDKIRIVTTYRVSPALADETLPIDTLKTGLALNLGETKIWAGLADTNIVAATTVNTGGNPTVSVSVRDGTTVKPLQTVIMDMNVELVMGAKADYELEARMPLGGDSEPMMKICGAWIEFRGFNIPCMILAEPEFEPVDAAVLNKNVLTWNLGRIMNSGIRDSDLAMFSAANVNLLTVRFAMQVLPHGDWSNNHQEQVQLGLDVGNDAITIAAETFTYQDATIDTSGSDAPEFTQTFKHNSETNVDKLDSGQSRDVRVTIKTAPGGVYSPMTGEAIVPFDDDNNRPLLTICNVRVVSVGKNMPCVNPAEINQGVTYSSKMTDTAEEDLIMDKADFNLGTLCNVASEASAEAADDTIELSMTVKMLDETADGDYWFSVGIQYGNSRIWVGQLQFTKQSAVAPFALANTDNVYINAEHVGTENNANEVGVGMTATYEVVVKTEPLKDSPVKLIATAGGGDALSVCNIRLIEAGENVPCAEKSTEPTFDKYSSGATEHNQVATLDLGVVSNTKSVDVISVDDSTFDANSLKFLVVVMLREASSADITFSVDMDTGSTKDMTPIAITNIALADVRPLPQASVPVLTIGVGTIGEETDVDTDMVEGETKLVHLTIEYTSDTAYGTTVEFFTEDNTLEICSVNVVFVGNNLPCVQKEFINMDDSVDTDGNEYRNKAAVAVGRVCHVSYYDTTTDQTPNQLIVEAVVRVVAGSGYTTSTVRTAVKFTDNAGTEHDGSNPSLPFGTGSGAVPMIGQNLATGATLELAAGADTLSPHATEQYTVNITIPANTTRHVVVDVETPVSDVSAYMTVVSAEVVFVGENLGCCQQRLADYEVLMTPHENRPASQMTTATIDLGYVTNDGHTYRANKHVDDYEHNALRYTFTIQMADPAAGTHGTQVDLSVGLNRELEILILNTPITIDRDPATDFAPDICLSLSEVGAPPVDGYTAGATITVQANFAHKHDTTTAEGNDVKGLFYHPRFLTFGAIQGDTPAGLTVDHTTDDTVIEFNLEHLYFTDSINFTFTMTVTSDDSIPTEASAATPFETACKTYNDPDDTIYYSRLDNLVLAFLASGSGAVCNTQNLGLADLTDDVAQCMYSSSHIADPAHAPHQARPDAAGWRPAIRPGQDKYLQINFGNVTKVSHMTFSTDDGSMTADRVTPAYSRDGLSWVTGDQVSLSWTGTSADPVTIANPQEARHLRLYVERTADTSPISLKVDMEGCFTSTDMSIEDVCSTHPWSMPADGTTADVYSRGFLTTPTSTVICDSASNGQACTTTDEGSTFTVVDPLVKTVIGYLPSEDILYAVSWDGRSYMASTNGGDTYMSISSDKMNEARNSEGYKAIKKVEWGTTDGTEMADGAHWKATNDGVFYSSAGDASFSKVSDWETCCST